MGSTMKVFGFFLCTLAACYGAPQGLYGHPAPYHAPAPAPYHAPVPAPYHAPAPHHAPEPVYKDEPKPYSFEYGVHDDYSGANFNAGEVADGSGNVEGSYSVLLPDGRTQHVKYDGTAHPAPVHHAPTHHTPVHHALTHPAPA